MLDSILEVGFGIPAVIFGSPEVGSDTPVMGLGTIVAGSGVLACLSIRFDACRRGMPRVGWIQVLHRDEFLRYCGLASVAARRRRQLLRLEATQQRQPQRQFLPLRHSVVLKATMYWLELWRLCLRAW
jgi:hypothetical protein